MATEPRREGGAPGGASRACLTPIRGGGHDQSRTPRQGARLPSHRLVQRVPPCSQCRLGAEVTVTLEIEASLPEGASEQLVRTVTENSRTLKFTTQGFERD